MGGNPMAEAALLRGKQDALLGEARVIPADWPEAFQVAYGEGFDSVRGKPIEGLDDEDVELAIAAAYSGV